MKGQAEPYVGEYFTLTEKSSNIFLYSLGVALLHFVVQEKAVCRAKSSLRNIVQCFLFLCFD